MRRGYILFEIMAICAVGAVAIGVFAWIPGTAKSHVLSGILRDIVPWTSTNRSRIAELPSPPRVAIAEQTVGTFLGIDDELALAHLRSQDIAEVRPNKGGSSISLCMTLASGARGAFKPAQTNYQTIPRKEVAAYRLNRWLGLTAVPPATMRTLHHDDLLAKIPAEAQILRQRLEAETIFDNEGFTRGEVSYWIPVVANTHLDTPEAIEQWTRWLTVGETIPSGKQELMAQLSTLLLFDLLQNNSDRFSGGNLLGSPDGRTLYFMDNTFGFQVEPEGHEKCRSFLKRSQKFSRRLVGRLRQLDFVTLREALLVEPDVLHEDEMRAVVARRDVALRYVDELIAMHGAEQVLVFP